MLSKGKICILLKNLLSKTFYQKLVFDHSESFDMYVYRKTLYKNIFFGGVRQKTVFAVRGGGRY